MKTPSTHFYFLHRAIVVMQYLTASDGATSTAIRAHLLTCGHDISERAVQRMLSDMQAMGIIQRAARKVGNLSRHSYQMSERSPVRVAA